MEVQRFETPEGVSVRVIMRDGAPWFIAADACKILGVDRTSLERLDDDEKGVDSIHTPGGDQRATILSEPGLYSLILGSRKPEAKAFKRWVTHEVIPAIRRTGSYSATPRNYRDAVAALLETLDAKEKAEKELGEAQPAIEFHARIAKADGEFGITEAAYEVGVKVPELVQFLISKGYALRRGSHGKAGEKKGKLEPTHYPVSMGYMRLRMVEVGGVAYPQPVFTPRGVEWVSKHLRKAA